MRHYLTFISSWALFTHFCDASIIPSEPSGSIKTPATLTHLRRHLKCPPGTYSLHSSGVSPCNECPPGTFSDALGSMKCSPSGQPDHYTPDKSKSTSPTPCPTNVTSRSNDTNSSSTCAPYPASSDVDYHIKQKRSPNYTSSDSSISSSNVETHTSTYPPPVPNYISLKRAVRPPRCMTAGQKACPLYSAAIGRVQSVLLGYECIDVVNNLESCGGCVDRSSKTNRPSRAYPRDCSVIPGVDTVRCEAGRCYIESCRAGFIRSHDRQ
ncbi:hypothetical protein E4T56_gene6160, partial [Termitomyces sp. T112]